MLAPPSDCADAKATALTPLRKVTMYSPGIGSPIAKSSALFGTVVVVEEVVVDVVVVVVEEVVVDVVDVVVDVVLDEDVEVAGVVVDVGMTVVETEVVEVLVVLDELEVVNVVVVLSAIVVVEAMVVDVTCVVVGATALVVVEATVVVVLSSVAPTLKVASGSTINTCGSRFNRRTSAASSSATNPFTLLEKTLFTSLPSDSSLLTLAATLAASESMTTYSRVPLVLLGTPAPGANAVPPSWASTGTTGSNAARSGTKTRRGNRPKFRTTL